jgi:beta-N-acetylhexosaminidase
MTAHLRFAAIDPQNPATTSAKVVSEIIRGAIGFDGLLFTDDLSMKALGGAFGERTRAAFAAGVDVALHCNGDMAEARPVAEASPPLAGKSLARAEALMRASAEPDAFDVEAGRARLASLFPAA